MALVVNAYPDKPAITQGPATVDNYTTTTSTYVCAEAANTLTYQWAVSPSEAGSTASTGTTAEFSWAAGYTGTVQITVTGNNDCGNGEVSDAFTTEIYSSLGLIDNGSMKEMVIYPNPGRGLFTVRMPASAGQKADMRVVDASGAVIYLSEGLNISTDRTIHLNLAGQPDGIYTLKVNANDQVFQSKLIIQHN